MPFKFAYFCDLLERLEDLETADPPLLVARKVEQQNETLHRWFAGHRKTIDTRRTDRAALLSSFLPERRTDRVYGLQEVSLSRVLGRCLGLGSKRLQDLHAWNPSCAGDLARWVARIQSVTDASLPVCTISVEEIDNVLHDLAKQCRFSSPNVRSKKISAQTGTGHRETQDHKVTPDEILRPIIQRLRSRELKWFVRIILKKIAPVVLDEHLILKSIHFLLPRILKFQSSFGAAFEILSNPLLAVLPTQQQGALSESTWTSVASCLRPRLGVKIGRPQFNKARSIKHCLALTGKRRWNIEPKYDGEYCQVHVDLTKGRNCIQIFSKNGKDSTMDKLKLHSWIKRCLRIGTKECKFRTRCIVEGEMVVYSDKDNSILEFSKIRKHVPRSGTLIGTRADSQAHDCEHLMIIFFDALLIDDDNVMSERYEERRRRLRELLLYFPGRAQTADWGTIDFSKISSARAAKRIAKAFAKAIASRCEGLVLKPTDGPYFSVRDPRPGCFDGQVIKLKKDYIPGLGDTADFAVLGASYNAADAHAGHIVGKYTSFAIGCLDNKEEVLRFSTLPIFRFLGMIGRPCISPENIVQLTSLGQYTEESLSTPHTPTAFRLTDPRSTSSITAAFTKPFIVEVLGAGFEKPPNTDYYMLRFPRIIKIHHDRSYEDVVSFSALQSMAKESFKQPDDLRQKEAEWLEKIVQTGWPKRKVYVDNDSAFSQHTTEQMTSTNTSPVKTPRWIVDETTAVREDPTEAVLACVPAGIMKQLANNTQAMRSSADLGSDPPPRLAVLSDSTKRKSDFIHEAVRQESFKVRKVMHNAPEPVTNSDSIESSFQLCSRVLREIKNASSLNAVSRITRLAFAERSLPAPKLPEDIGEQLVVPTRPPVSADDSVSSSLNFHTAPSSPIVTRAAAKFANSAFYLAPCLAKTPYLHDLLESLHNRSSIPTTHRQTGKIPWTTNIAHWQRAVATRPTPWGAVVHESQAFEGLAKVAIVESKRMEPTSSVVQDLLMLDLVIDEVVEVWDWRAVEAAADCVSVNQDKWYLGCVKRQGGTGNNIWVPH